MSSLAQSGTETSGWATSFPWVQTPLKGSPSPEPGSLRHPRPGSECLWGSWKGSPLSVRVLGGPCAILGKSALTSAWKHLPRRQHCNCDMPTAGFRPSPNWRLRNTTGQEATQRWQDSSFWVWNCPIHWWKSAHFSCRDGRCRLVRKALCAQQGAWRVRPLPGAQHSACHRQAGGVRVQGTAARAWGPTVACLPDWR